MNSVCERFLGSVRRECLDHVIILRGRHLERVLREYCFRYVNASCDGKKLRVVLNVSAGTTWGVVGLDSP
jgi:hypothetical protein